MATFSTGANFAIDFRTLNLANLNQGTVTIANANQIRVNYASNYWDDFFGNFTYDGFGQLAGGTWNRTAEVFNNQTVFDVRDFSMAVATFAFYYNNNDGLGLLTELFSGNDSLTGGSLDNDYLMGFAGNDTLNGGAGADGLEGGTGNDTYVVNTASDQVIEDSAAGTDKILSSVSRTLAANVENLTLTGSLNTNGTGNGLSNNLLGNAGNNILNGAGGNDTINGAGGNDTLYGGIGNDVFNVAAGDVLNENAGEGNDRVFSTTSFSLGANLEELTLTGSGNTNGNGNILSNHLVGNSGNNILNGGSGGNDSIEGGSGADSLIGGTGDDTMVGGAGNDTMVGGAGNDAYVVMAGDTLSETLTGTDGGIDRVFSSTSFSLGGNLENLTLTGTANINATGNILGNRLTGNSGNNVLTGNGGNDILDGLGGNDTMIGGVGNDTYVLGAGDTISETTAGSAGGTDTVLSNVSHTIGANIENLTLLGSSNLNGVGNSLDNLVTGNTGNNVLSSLDGADTLIGGGGADTLLGGAGDDTIAIADTAFGRLDGGTGTDTLRLDGSGLSLDLATFGVRVAGIERIDMGGTGNHSLTLSAADVLADSDTDQLVVLGDSGDQVTATGTWTANGTQTIEGQTYNVYTGGGATLLVDSDIVQNVPTS